MISLTLCSREILKPLLRITASLLSRNMGSPCSNSAVHPQAPCASESSKRELGRCGMVPDCWRPMSSQCAARARRDSPAGTWGYGWAPEMLLVSLLNSLVIFSPVKATAPGSRAMQKKTKHQFKGQVSYKASSNSFLFTSGKSLNEGKGKHIQY